MKRIRQIFKALFVSVAVAMIALAPMGCGGSDDKKAPDKAPTEHSNGDHPDADHPAGDHPE